MRRSILSTAATAVAALLPAAPASPCVEARLEVEGGDRFAITGRLLFP